MSGYLFIYLSFLPVNSGYFHGKILSRLSLYFSILGFVFTDFYWVI